MNYNLSLLEAYYAKLQDYLIQLMQLQDICDNTKETLHFLDIDEDKIEETLMKNDIPHYSDFKFDQIKKDGYFNTELESVNSSCKDKINEMIEEVKRKIQIISKDINTAKDRARYSGCGQGGGGGGAYLTSDIDDVGIVKGPSAF